MFQDDPANGFVNPSTYSGHPGAGWNATSNGIEHNNQCLLDLLNAWTSFNINLGQLDWNMPIYFKPAFAGGKKLYTRTVGTNNPWEFSGTWTVPNPATKPPSVGIDSPSANATVTGTVTISGWALDNTITNESNIQTLKVYIDGNYLGPATTGLSHPSACVTSPGRAGCPNVGFSASWNTTYSGAGAHVIMIMAIDADSPTGLRTVAERTVYVN